MKAEIRALLADFKAAARIGHPQSLQAARDRLAALPEVAGNGPLSDAFLDQVILPLGQTLASPLLPAALLRPWLQDPLAGVRAAAAAGLGLGSFGGKDVPRSDLLRAGRDARPEVRRALAAGLARGAASAGGAALAGSGDAGRLLPLIEPWLGDPSPRLRHTALLALEQAARTRPQDAGVLALLEPLKNDPDAEVRAALVSALSALAGGGLAEAVLDRLAAWALEPGTDTWVISRALSASWAAQHPEKALAILRDLEAQAGPGNQIRNARRALERHQKDARMGRAK